MPTTPCRGSVAVIYGRDEWWPGETLPLPEPCFCGEYERCSMCGEYHVRVDLCPACARTRGI